MSDAMTLKTPPRRSRPPRGWAGHGLAALCCAAAGLSGCGGGGSNPLDNPASVNNPAITTGQKLAFAYFQKCINPIFLAQLSITVNGVTTINTCAASGCHDNAAGTGGAFRVIPSAVAVDLANAANTPDVIRLTDMYKNFYSAQASTIIGSPTQSRLLTKPLVLNVLHGGGIIFANAQDPNVKLMEYWLTRPAPTGQDEFSTATYSMFTPADPVTGTCNTL
jgi:hypothetical protein